MATASPVQNPPRSGGSGSGPVPTGAGNVAFGNAGATAFTDSASLNWDDINKILAESGSLSGGSVTETVSNTSNNASSNAVIEAKVAGASGGNPTVRLTIPTGTSYDIRTNNASTDNFEILRAGTAKFIMSSVDGIAVGGGAPLTGYDFVVRPTGGAAVKQILYSGNSTAVDARLYVVASTPGVFGVISSGGSAVSGTTCGVSNAGLFAMWNDSGTANTTAVLTGTTTAIPYYVGSNGTPRAVFTSAGNIAFFPAMSSGADATNYRSMVGGWVFTGPSTAPVANPAADQYFIYVDPADHKLKSLGSAGTVTVLGSP